MPSHVKIFFWLAVSAVAYTILSTVWILVFPSPEFVALLAKFPPALRETTVRSITEMTVVSTGVWAAIKLPLIWLAAYRRQNWARWSYAFIAAFQIALPFVSDAFLHRFANHAVNRLAYRWDHPLTLLPTLVVLAAIFFVFSGNANGWFRPREAAPAAA